MGYKAFLKIAIGNDLCNSLSRYMPHQEIYIRIKMKFCTFRVGKFNKENVLQLQTNFSSKDMIEEH